MPQFDFAKVFWPQFIWLAVFFAILYFGVVRLTLPRLGRVVTRREDQVSGDVKAAETAKAEADRIGADYDADVAAAHDRARTRVLEAHAAAAAALEGKLHASDAELAARTAAAQASLATARGRALDEIESVVADVAADIVERLTGARPAAEATGRAAQAALA